MVFVLIASTFVFIGLGIFLHNLGFKRGQIKAKMDIIEILDDRVYSARSCEELIELIIEDLKR